MRQSNNFVLRLENGCRIFSLRLFFYCWGEEVLLMNTIGWEYGDWSVKSDQVMCVRDWMAWLKEMPKVLQRHKRQHAVKGPEIILFRLNTEVRRWRAHVLELVTGKRTNNRWLYQNLVRNFFYCPEHRTLLLIIIEITMLRTYVRKCNANDSARYTKTQKHMDNEL